MSFSPPKGWERDSDKLYIHETGVRIQLMPYRQKDGWYIVPIDLDQPVVEFEPTPEGRTKAFEAFAAGLLEAKPKRKKVETPEAKKKKADKAAAKAKEEEEEEAEGDDDDDEKEEKAAPDEDAG